MNDFNFDFDDSIPEFDIVVQHVTTEGGGGGQTIEIDSELSTTSNNPVKNKVITVELNKKINAASLAAVATSGSYNDLTNKPTIPSSFPVDVELDDESTNPVQNAVITNALGNKMDYPGGGVAGYVLQKTAEGAQWASIGTPSQEQIYQAVTAYIALHPDVLRPISPETKAALLQIAEKVVYVDEHGQDYYNALDAALNATALLQITAVYTQSGTVYDSASLDSLKPDLVVTAYYDDGTSAVIASGYTLSGTLEVGTSTITATYSGKSATFDVTVTEYIPEGWLYHFNGDLLSSGTKDFGFTGTANYSTGYDGTGESYWHKLTEGTSSTDPGAIVASGLASADQLDTSGDFTISMWHKTVTANMGSIWAMYDWGSSTSGTSNNYGATSNVKSGWTATMEYGTNKQQMGMRLAWNTQAIKLRLISSNLNTSAQYSITPPSSFDSTQWHHYAVTRSGSTLYFFVDGAKIFQATVSGTIHASSQVCVCGYWSSASTTPAASSYGGYADDFYVANTCKWTSDFDPTTITY